MSETSTTEAAEQEPESSTMNDNTVPFAEAAAALKRAVLEAAGVGRRDFEAQIEKLRAAAATTGDNLARTVRIRHASRTIICPADPETGLNAMGLSGAITVRADPTLRPNEIRFERKPKRDAEDGPPSSQLPSAPASPPRRSCRY